jgi:hypothetical protein
MPALEAPLGPAAAAEMPLPTREQSVKTWEGRVLRLNVVVPMVELRSTKGNSGVIDSDAANTT